MVFSSKARSPSSVFGGKNSNETTGRRAASLAAWMSRINCICKLLYRIRKKRKGGRSGW